MEEPQIYSVVLYELCFYFGGLLELYIYVYIHTRTDIHALSMALKIHLRPRALLARLWVSGVQLEGSVLGFGVWGLGFGVSGLGFRVWGLGFRGIFCLPMSAPNGKAGVCRCQLGRKLPGPSHA